MAEISHLNTDHPGSFLCSLTLYRTHDGRVIANLTDMAAWEIEGKDTIRERFEMLAAWTSESATNLLQQALEFEDTDNE